MIVINSIEKKFGPKVLFDGCCAAINPRHRTALVGPNGSGKTMLARMICGQASPDSGAIAVPASLHIAHLAQEMAIEAASAGYGGPPVFAGLTLSVNRGDKVAIIGPNGAGKSTLLRMCAGLIAPSAGRIRTGGNAIVRYYGQHRLEQLDPDKTLYDTIAAAAPAMASSAIQSILGLFLFSGEDALKTAGVLSGGEKARLSLASILADPGNVLLLDEPTNHLDIESVERLADALATFEGTALIVSHDEFFLNRTATRILEIRPGTYRYFPGSLADYRSYIEEGYIETLQGPNGPAGGGREGAVTREKTAKEQRVLTRESRKQLERRIRKTEEEVQALEEEIAALKKTVDDPANAHDFQLLHETLETTGGKQAEADRLTDEWGRLQEELDTLNSENPA